jgi:hypothetical protein
MREGPGVDGTHDGETVGADEQAVTREYFQIIRRPSGPLGPYDHMPSVTLSRSVTGDFMGKPVHNLPIHPSTGGGVLVRPLGLRL